MYNVTTITSIIRKYNANVFFTIRLLFTDVLAKYLCREGVSYLQIDNEFHLSNVILRFYDITNYEEFKSEFWFSNLDGDKVITFDIYDIARVRPEIKGFEDGLVDVLTGYDDISDNVVGDVVEKSKAPVYTKRMIRQDNKMMNQKAKNNCGNRRINRRFY